ncbi:hypothetical protein D1872_275080 [compost metagenome]
MLGIGPAEVEHNAPVPVYADGLGVGINGLVNIRPDPYFVRVVNAMKIPRFLRYPCSFPIADHFHLLLRLAVPGDVKHHPGFRGRRRPEAENRHLRGIRSPQVVTVVIIFFIKRGVEHGNASGHFRIAVIDRNVNFLLYGQWDSLQSYKLSHETTHFM